MKIRDFKYPIFLLHRTVNKPVEKQERKRERRCRHVRFIEYPRIKSNIRLLMLRKKVNLQLTHLDR